MSAKIQAILEIKYGRNWIFLAHSLHEEIAKNIRLLNISDASHIITRYFYQISLRKFVKNIRQLEIEMTRIYKSWNFTIFRTSSWLYLLEFHNYSDIMIKSMSYWSNCLLTPQSWTVRQSKVRCFSLQSVNCIGNIQGIENYFHNHYEPIKYHTNPI